MKKWSARIGFALIALSTATATSTAAREHLITWLFFAAVFLFLLGMPASFAALVLRRSDVLWLFLGALFCAATSLYLFVLLLKTRDTQAVACFLGVLLWLSDRTRRRRSNKKEGWLPRERDVPAGVIAVMLITSVIVFIESPAVRPTRNVLQCKLAYRARPVGVRGEFYDLKIDATGGRLFFSQKATRQVGFLNLENGSFMLSPDLGDGPEQIVPLIDGNELATYLKGSFNVDKMALLDASTLNVIKQCPIGDFVDLAPTAVPGVLAGIKEFRPYFYWISPRRCEEKKGAIATAMPYQVLCVTRERRCYISGWFTSRALSVVNLADDGSVQNVRSLVLGPFSMGMALDERRNLLYVSRPLAGCVDVVDLKIFRRVGRIPAPTMVRAIAIAPELDLIFLPTYFGGIVHVSRLSTGEELFELRAGYFVREILWNKERRTLFVASVRGIYAADLGKMPLQTGAGQTNK